MSIYAGFIFIALSSIYTFSYAKKIWEKSKSASLGAVLLVFLSIGAAIYMFMRT